jgi:hypothetical protein
VGEDEFKKHRFEYKKARNLGNFEKALREKLENGGRNPFKFLKPL